MMEKEQLRGVSGRLIHRLRCRNAPPGLMNQSPLWKSDPKKSAVTLQQFDEESAGLDGYRARWATRRARRWPDIMVKMVAEGGGGSEGTPKDSDGSPKARGGAVMTG